MFDPDETPFSQFLKSELLKSQQGKFQIPKDWWDELQCPTPSLVVPTLYDNIQREWDW